MYDRLRGYARQYLGGLGPELKKYFAEYQRDLKDFKAVSTKLELLSALQKTDLVFCGDYHTLSQAQRTVIRLLRDSITSFKSAGRPLFLALEMVRSQDNPFITKYLDGKISETEFLRQISFDRTWGFSWANYRALFQFAKQEGIKIVGINTNSKRVLSLRERDKHVAKVISNLTEKDPDALIFVLIGDLHLAQGHLPRDVQVELKERGLHRKQLVIHQNIERFYWQLVDRGLEHRVDVVKVKEGVFCVMNTPPWIKLQSHLKWLELISEGGATPSLSALRSPEKQIESIFDEVDLSEEVSELVDVIETFLGLPKRQEDNFQIHGPSERHVFQYVYDDMSSFESKILEACLTQFKSFYVARLNALFLSNLNVNHASSQAAIYLFCVRTGFVRTFQCPAEDFYPFIWVEALGFLGSKIINHKRKCNGYRDLKRFAAGSQKREEVKIVRWVLRHLDIENKNPADLSNLLLPKTQIPVGRVLFYYKTAKILGALLGEGIYSALIESKIERSEVRRFFETPGLIDKSRTAKSLYLEWIQRLDAFGFRQVIKTDKL
jgi:hypothetical protein